MSQGSKYEPRYTKRFEKSFKKNVPNNLKQRIEDGINKLLEDPYHNTEFGKGLWRGKRKLRVGDYRIAFIICEECQKLDHKVMNRCGEENHQPSFLMVVDLIVGHDYEL